MSCLSSYSWNLSFWSLNLSRCVMTTLVLSKCIILATNSIIILVLKLVKVSYTGSLTLKMHHCGLKVYHFGPWTRQRMSYAISLIDPCPGANGGMLNMCSNGANMNLNFREILLQGTNISWNCCGTLTFFSLAKAHWAVCYSKEISVPQQRKNIPVSHGKFHISGVCHSKFSLISIMRKSK